MIAVKKQTMSVTDQGTVILHQTKSSRATKTPTTPNQCLQKQQTCCSWVRTGQHTVVLPQNVPTKTGTPVKRQRNRIVTAAWPNQDTH